MAAALVGGALLSALFPYLLQKLDGVVADFFKRRKLDEQLLKKLKNFMLSVQKLLDDAEEKHITKPAVKTWLDDLRDVLYEADDFLDEICYDAMQLEMEAGAPETSKRRGRKFISSLNPFKKGKKEKPAKLEEILGRLQDLVGQKDVLGLIEVIGQKPYTHKIPKTSIVDKSCVYGRDADKEEIKKRLLSADASNVAVIPIVGMGGLGKTTLAQLVFNEVEEGQFDLKAWVCVSDEYNVEKVTREILQGFTKQASDAGYTLDLLQNQLKEKLKEKRYLLVLDDVWEHRWANSWDSLKTPLLSFGGRGSRIIVTTREREVARIMHAMPYDLKELPEEDSRKVLANELDPEDYSSLDSVELQEILEELVGKCSGLPLAAKMIGSLLHRKDARDWKKIAKSSLWHLESDANILPAALRLSYHHLPSHLKQCFAYSAIIPKDYSFKKEEIVRWWMAEGILGRPKEDVNMEEIGREYFDDLVSRSFFQQADDEGQCFIMHDLINDLAKSVSGEFCCTFESKDACNIMGRARHVSCQRTEGEGDNLQEKFKRIGGAKSLRTFLPFPVRFNYRGVVPEFDNEALCELLSTHKCLRVLSVSGYPGIDKLPDSMGQMKHLRYLDLSGTFIKRLPQVVGLLHNLETLSLEDCRELTMLPDSIGNLSHLCYLNIDRTAITRLPDSVNRLHKLQTFILCKLEVMPPQVGQLNKLQRLSRFIVGRESGCEVKELGQLNLLGGKLSICNLQNTVNAEDALEARLKDKENLTELVLEWDSKAERAESFKVLENLKPHRKLERLSVHRYGATRFPNWMADSSFTNMVELKITDCNNVTSLPSLGQLPSLKKLFIKGFRRLVTVGPEFYGSCASTREPFGSLETLFFEDMPEWCEWRSPHREAESNESGGPFPLLQNLNIIGCPKLRCQQIVGSLPRPRPDTLFSMTVVDDSRDVRIEKEQYGGRRYVLRIQRYNSTDPVVELIQHPVFVPSAWDGISIFYWDSIDCLASSVLSFARGIEAPNLKLLSVGACSNLKSLPGHMHSLLPSLEELYIGQLPKLDSFPEAGLPPALKSLSIGGCDKLVGGRFPEETLLPSTLETLQLRDLRNWTTWDSKGLEHLTSLKEIRIFDCPSIESLPAGELLPRLEELRIDGCKTLVANRLQWNLQSFPSLLRLVVGGCDDVESFPEEMLLPSTLASLQISPFENLTSLNYNGLRHLTSLTELTIVTCPKLQSLPEEGLPSSLSSLSIWACPLLRQRCAEGTGEDWPKISHIPEIRIRG